MNANPGWAHGYVPQEGEWNALFASKVDATNGTLTNPAVTGGTFSAPAITGAALAGGTIDNATIGLTTPVAGTFTSLIAGGAASGRLTLSANAIAMQTGQNLTLSMGGNASTFTLAGTGGTGNLLVATAASGQNTFDLTSSNTLFKTSKTFLNAATVTYAGGQSDTVGPFTVSMNTAGSATGTDFPFYYLRINSDAVAAPSTAIGIKFNHNFGNDASPTMTGGRTGFMVYLKQVGNTANAANSIDPYYEGARLITEMSRNEGGTGTLLATSAGHNYALSTYAKLLSGATNRYANVGWEHDAYLDPAASVARNVGITQQLLAGSTGQGTITHAVLVPGGPGGAAQSTSAWRDIITVGDAQVIWPLAANGAIIRAKLGAQFTTYSNTSSYGVDLNEGLWTQAAFRSRGNWAVLSDGTQTIGVAALAPTTAGLSLDVSGLTGLAEATAISGAPLVSGGTSGFAINDVLRDAFGGVYYVTTVASGIITGLSVYRQSFAPVGTSATVTLTPDPASAGAGTVQITQTWTSKTTLSVQPSGGPLKIGAGMMTGNGSVATTMTSLGPAGSHTTVQEWLTVTNAAGVVRYIPAY